MAGRKNYELLFALKADAAQFQKEMKGSGAAVEVLRSHMAALRSGMGDISAYQRQQKAVETTRGKIERFYESYNRLGEEIAQAEHPSERMIRKWNQQSEVLGKYNAQLKKQQEELERLSVLMDKAGFDRMDLDGERTRLQRTREEMARYNQELEKLEAARAENSRAIGETKRRLIITGATVTAAAAGGYQAFIRPAADFEAQMSGVEAIAQLDGREMADLSALAREMGSTTKFTAVEAGQGLEYMAMAGWSSQEMAAGLPGVMQLAAASGEDLAAVSDIVTDALTAFGLSAADSAHFSDVLAQASASSNTDVGRMGETFRQVALVAGALGYSIEDMSVAIGLMANSGIKGERAGTALKNIIANLASPTAQMQEAMTDLGVSISDTDGKTKRFETIMRDLRGSMQGMSEEQQVSYATAIAGKEAFAGLLAVVNAADADFAGLYADVDNCAGAAKRMAEVRLDNLNGDITLVQSAWEGLAIAVGDGFTPELREGAQALTGLLGQARDWAAQNGDLLVQLVKLGGILTGTKVGFEALKLGSLGISKTFLETKKVAKGLSAGIKLLAQGGTVTSAAKVVSELTGELAAFSTVVPLVVTGAALVGTAVKALWDDAKQADLDRRFGDITLSLEELDQVAGTLAEGKALEEIDRALSAFGALDGAEERLHSLGQTLDKYNWMVDVGVQLTPDQREDYQREMDAYVRGVQEYVTEQGYAVQLGISTFLGPEEAGQMGSAFSSITAAMQSTVTELGGELGQHLANAFQDDMFNIDAFKAAQNLQAKLARIEQISTDAAFHVEMRQIEMELSGGELTAESYKALMDRKNQLLQAYDAHSREGFQDTATEMQIAVEQAKFLQSEADTPEELAQAKRMEREAQAGVDRFLTEADPTRRAAQSYAEQMLTELDEIGKRYPEAMGIVTGATDAAAKAVGDASARGVTDQNERNKAIWKGVEQEKRDWNSLPPTARANFEEIADILFANIGQVEEQIEAYRRAGEEIPQALDKVMDRYLAFQLLMGTNYDANVVGGIDVGRFRDPSGTLDKLWDSKTYRPDLKLPGPALQVLNPEPGPVIMPAPKSVISTGKSVPFYAAGTSCTEDTFVAGEKGPEIVTNAPGYTVFNAGETQRILEQYRQLRALGDSRPEDVTPPAAWDTAGVPAPGPLPYQTVMLHPALLHAAMGRGPAAVELPTLQAPPPEREIRIEINSSPVFGSAGDPETLAGVLRRESERLAGLVLEKVREYERDRKWQNYD